MRSSTNKQMTDAAGAAILTIVFDPWGGQMGGSWSQNSSQQRRRFTTYERDGNESDEAMMRRYNRFYSRFDQPDPNDGAYDFTNPQSFNRYAYVQNDPVNFVDPSGLCPEGTTQVTDPATGDTDCVSGPTGFVEIMPDPDPFWDSFPANSIGPIIIDVTLMPTPLIPLLPDPEPQNPSPTCGVNPVTGQPGFTRNPVQQPGHLRAPIGGQGQFGAPRPKQKSGRHAGLDIAGTLNVSPVYAFLPGRITFAGPTGGDGGTLVVIDHGKGITSSYVHLQNNSIPASMVTTGQKPPTQTTVSQGQQIGTLGNSGNAGKAPPHVHFWIKRNGVLQDPETFLNSPCPP